MIRCCAWSWGVLGTLLLGGCASTERTTILDRPAPVTTAQQGDFVHASSGARFPAVVGGFTRTKTLRHDVDGLNISASYRGAEGVQLTLYVYPGAQDENFSSAARGTAGNTAGAAQREAQIELVRAEIMRFNPRAELERQGQAVLRTASGLRPAQVAVFRLRDGNGAATGTTLAQVWIERQRWFVKVRATASGMAAAELEERVSDFLQSAPQW